MARTLRLPDDLKAWVERQARDEHTSEQAVIEGALSLARAAHNDAHVARLIANGTLTPARTPFNSDPPLLPRSPEGRSVQDVLDEMRADRG